MTFRDDRITVQQMLDHAREAVSLAQGRSRSQLDGDRMAALALAQLIQTVGRIAFRLSEEFRKEHPEVRWDDLSALRNQLMDSVETANVDDTWRVLTVDLPALISKLEGMALPERFGEPRFQDRAVKPLAGHLQIDVPAEKIAHFCKRRHIRRLSFFGSVLRDDFGPDSDVDVLVEFEPGRTPGLAFFSMQDELSQILGRTVDLNTPNDLSPYYRDGVLGEAEPVYGAP